MNRKGSYPDTKGCHVTNFCRCSEFCFALMKCSSLHTCVCVALHCEAENIGKAHSSILLVMQFVIWRAQSDYIGNNIVLLIHQNWIDKYYTPEQSHCVKP